MRALELRVPPPAVALVVGVLMWPVARALLALTLELPAHRLIALGLASAGVATAISGVAAFAQARTTINPTKPEASSSLVIFGVYKLTRNPMYLGLLLVLSGWAVYLSNYLALLFLPGFVLYISRFQIAPEERALTALFGRAFVEYQSRVRRWI